VSLPPAAAANDEVRALLDALERHEPGQRLHAVRVAAYATATGHRLGFDEEALWLLARSALLHDVGKLGVEPALLRAAGPLADDQVAAIREHAALGWEAIQGLERAAGFWPAIRDHHERLDGSGYPAGLRKPDVPLPAQVVGLCEAFDTVVHGAPWAAARGRAAGREAAGRWARAWFEPDAVAALLDVEPLIQPVGAP
jgi:HD-GYP domain-containing protein (c-di-GMP phosphodiesterase class II)